MACKCTQTTTNEVAVMFSRNALVAAVVLALAGCGGSGSDSASVSSGTGSENAQPAKPGGPRALPEGEGEDLRM